MRLQLALEVIKEVQDAIGNGFINIPQAVIISQLPRTATPYEGNKADFMRYIRRHYDGEWTPTEALYVNYPALKCEACNYACS